MNDIIIPDCIFTYIEATDEGNRNEHLFRAASSIKDLNKKISYEELRGEINALNDLLNEGLDEEEVNNIVKSVWSKKYSASCKRFKDYCPGKKQCILFKHNRKPIDFTSVNFLDGRYMLSAWKKNGDYLYVLYDRGRDHKDYKRLTQDYTTPKKPLDLPNNSLIVSRLRDVLKDEYSKKRAKEEFVKIMDELESQLKDDESILIELEEYDKQAEAEVYADNLDQGKHLMRTLDHPLQHIGCVVDWLAAGERTNILFGFLSFLHLMVYDEPINFIVVGRSTSGKSVIANTALKLLPPEFVLKEKQPRPAPMYRWAEDDPYHYKGKVVYYGDLGGTKDIEESEEARNILKEMNTEGYVNKNIAVKVQGDWKTFTLELFGKPALCYTTVHAAKVDEQEASRGFVISPRTDNDKMVTKRDEVLEVGGKTAVTLRFIEKKEVEAIRNMVRHLCEVPNLEVINPYMPAMKAWIENSPFIKRDYKKILRLARMITILNYNHREVWVDGEYKYLITTPEDVTLLYSILRDYMISIAKNIPKSILELFNVLKEKYDSTTTFTINDVRKTLKISDPNLGKHLSRLRDSGLIYVDKQEGKGKGNINVYRLSNTKLDVPEMTDLKVTDKTKRMLEFEHSSALVDFILSQENNAKSISIHEWVLDGYNPPLWEYSELNKNISGVKLRDYRKKENMDVDEGDEVNDDVVVAALKEYDYYG